MKTSKRKLWLIIIILPALSVLFSLISCQTAAEAQNGQEAEQENIITQTGNEAQIEMRNTKFNPDVVTIKQGTTITWINNDPAIHTVTSGTRNNETGIFDSGNMGRGETFSYTFNDRGTFDYFCRLHPGMDGTIMVE